MFKKIVQTLIGKQEKETESSCCKIEIKEVTESSTCCTTTK